MIRVVSYYHFDVKKSYIRTFFQEMSFFANAYFDEKWRTLRKNIHILSKCNVNLINIWLNSGLSGK